MRSERRTVLEKRKREYRTIYEMLFETPRVLVKNIEKVIGSLTTSRRLKEARDLERVVGPDVRRKSFENMKEYVYFVNFETPELAYLKYCEDENVIYHAKMVGFANLWIIAKDKLDIEEDIILEGYRSDYYVSYAPDHSWEKALEIMREKLDNFGPDTYEPKGLIETHFDEPIEWDEEDEALYRYFKYDLRKSLGPAIRKCKISRDKLSSWLERLPECCSINIHYYPEGLSAYDPYLFMVETDYEDFIVELFSELPTSASFFKVSDKLFVLTYVPEKVARSSNRRTAANKLQIPLLLIDLLERGIVTSEDYSIVEYFWAKDL